jgi:geranylgeranyl pyrophosphate synthase
MVTEAKLLRAALVFAAGSTFGASSSALMPAAVSIELLHLASLVHDDIIDKATERRGMRARHVVVGSDRALVVGDLLIVAAFEELRQAQPPLPADVFADAVGILAEAARLCCSGELEELAADALSEDRYVRLVAKKTGSLFSAAAALGGLIAGPEADAIAALSALGTELGVAYQIRDDLHDGRGRLPTSDLYARAAGSARAVLARVPASSTDALAEVVEVLLGDERPAR